MRRRRARRSVSSRSRPWRVTRAGASVILVSSAAAAAAALTPSAAQAHSLESSTISAHVTRDGVDATVTIALEALDQALGTDHTSEPDPTSYADEVTAYLGDHLTVTGADGGEWSETFSGTTRETVDGIESITVDVALDAAGSDPSAFQIRYDAVIEAVPTHEAVVVLTDPSGQVSTAGVLTTTQDVVSIGDVGAPTGAVDAGVIDMVGHGFHHVLQGADHLLFLAALLLTAPVVAVRGRWRPRTAAAPTVAAVLGVVTSFTLGHSVTLIASALGWVDIPTRPVEVLVAVSVGVASVHAVRPLVRGANVIAAGFGLVHGLAFAGILTDLGLTGSTSLLNLLAFNVGVELSQLAVTLAVFPSLYLLARTRSYPATRAVGGVLGLGAATLWVLERVGVLGNPFEGAETAAVTFPWAVAAGLAVIAVVAFTTESRRPARRS